VYLATTPPAGQFGLPQNFSDIITGKVDYGLGREKSLLNDRVSF